MTSPWLRAGTLHTCSRLVLHQDSHLLPASQARVPFLPVCCVSYLFSEEKTYPQPDSLPPNSQLFTGCTGGHKTGGDACVSLIITQPQAWVGRPFGQRVTHPCRGIRPSSPEHLRAGCRARCSHACSISFSSLPSLQRTEEVARLRGLNLFGLTLCLWLSRQASVSHL